MISGEARRVREDLVWKLYLSGKSFRAIGREVGIDTALAFRTVQRLRPPPTDAEDRRSRVLDSLEGMLQKWYPVALGPDNGLPDLTGSAMVLRILDAIVRTARLDKEPLIDITVQLQQYAESEGLPLDEVLAEADRIVAGDSRLWRKLRAGAR